MSFFFFFFQFLKHLCVHSHVHVYTMHSVDIENKKRENKNTFKDRVKFPILECTVEIRETKHSKIVVESSVGCHCRDTPLLLQVCGVIVG